MVWLVLDNHMSFVEDQSGWTGTTTMLGVGRLADMTEEREEGVPTRGSTDPIMPQAQLATAVQPSTATLEVSQ